MNIIDTITATLGSILYTPQGQYYTELGVIETNTTPPTRAGKAEFWRIVTNATRTMEQSRQSMRDFCYSHQPAIPPEINRIISMLRRTQRACHNAQYDIPNGIDEQSRLNAIRQWSMVGLLFAKWEFMILEYYPNLQSAIVNAPGGHQKTRKEINKESRERRTQKFKDDLVNTDSYKKAVNNCVITEPFTWNNTWPELVTFLLDCGVLPYSLRRDGTRHPQWSVAGQVFIVRGKPATGRKLSDTYQHMPNKEDYL